MDLQVEWHPVVPVRRVKEAVHAIDIARIPALPGVYVFGHRWGDSFEALYVGQAKNVRSRVKGQLNNLKLMTHLREAKGGQAGTDDRRGQA
jgi:hypothetical protein